MMDDDWKRGWTRKAKGRTSRWTHEDNALFDDDGVRRERK